MNSMPSAKISTLSLTKLGFCSFFLLFSFLSRILPLLYTVSSFLFLTLPQYQYHHHLLSFVLSSYFLSTISYCTSPQLVPHFFLPQFLPLFLFFKFVFPSFVFPSSILPSFLPPAILPFLLPSIHLLHSSIHPSTP